jgi:hypothetical protein
MLKASHTKVGLAVMSSIFILTVKAQQDASPLVPVGEAPKGEAVVSSQDQVALAKKLANPIAALISLPMQYNYDTGYGAGGDGTKQYLNIQPVIPVSLSEDWNLISRTILPLIDQHDMPRGNDNFGLGDVTQSLFLSPKAPSSLGGIIWGAGPVFLLPTATEPLLGSEKLGLGPTAVALKQSGPWTVGLLCNHIWSVGGEEDRSDVNTTFLQPFVNYITKTKTTLGVMTEAAYDWENEAWSIPVVPQIGQMFKIGPQIMQLTVGLKYWAESPSNGPEGFGARVQLTFLFPK